MSTGQRIGIATLGGILVLFGVVCAYLVLSRRGRRFAKESLSELQFRGGSLGDPAGLAVTAILMLLGGGGLTAYALAGGG